MNEENQNLNPSKSDNNAGQFDPNQPGGPAVVANQEKTPQKTPSNEVEEPKAQQDQGKASVIYDQIKKQAVKYVKKIATKYLSRTALVAALPYIAIALLIIIVVVLGIVLISRYMRGHAGRSQAQAESIYDPSTAGDIRVVLSEQIMVSNNPQDNYFSQGDPAFNQQPLNGHWENNEPYLKNAGCGITSCAMMMRYYGVTNVSPVQFANEMANGGSLALRPNFMLNYVNPVLKNQGKKERTITEIAANVQTIAKYIQNGDPVLAHGNPICDSKGEHYVLIVGISKDFSNFVISDPAAGKPRQSAARFCSQSDLLSHIKQLIVLQ